MLLMLMLVLHQVWKNSALVKRVVSRKTAKTKVCFLVFYYALNLSKKLAAFLNHSIEYAH
jgi:hypothetical protein